MWMKLNPIFRFDDPFNHGWKAPFTAGHVHTNTRIMTTNGYKYNCYYYWKTLSILGSICQRSLKNIVWRLASDFCQKDIACVQYTTVSKNCVQRVFEKLQSQKPFKCIVSFTFEYIIGIVVQTKAALRTKQSGSVY